MELGSTSESQNKPDTQSGRPKPGPFVPRTDHSPRELKSWAKKTGFNPNFSGETVSSVSDRDVGVDLEKGSELEGGSSSPKIEIDPILGRTREDRGSDIEPVSRRYGGGAVLGIQKKRIGAEPVLDERETQKEVSAITPTEETKKEVNKDEEQVHIDRFSDDYEPEHRGSGKPSGMKWGLRENPSYATLIYYSLQHYLSLAGSLIFIPLIIVPAMGGTDKDTATVISTMLLVSGISTIMHSYFGTRLPLVQGSSFVYLAPALVVLNSQEHRNLTENKFKNIMKELQGAIIVGSVLQCILGYSGLTSLLLSLACHALQIIYSMGALCGNFVKNCLPNIVLTA